MYTIPAPQEWQTFEQLCTDLWSEILNDKNTLKNGRNGQPQQGIDIYGVDKATGDKYGIQCKQKSLLKNLTNAEIDKEITNALAFNPPLDKYIIATTATKDVHIENYVRIKSQENVNNGFFSIHLYSWSDIVEKIYQYNNILQKYYSFITQPTNPNSTYFNFWCREALIDKLFYYASYLPFYRYSVDYSYLFIENSKGYLNKHHEFINGTMASNSNESLQANISHYNNTLKELINAVNESGVKETKVTDDDIIYTYWVDCEHLEYHKKDDYIENKKNNIRQLFYNLIKSANRIISLWNRELGNGQHISLIEFAQVNPNFPLFGELYLIEPHFPLQN